MDNYYDQNDKQNNGNSYQDNGNGYQDNSNGYQDNSNGYQNNNNGYQDNSNGYQNNNNGYQDNGNNYQGNIPNGNMYDRNDQDKNKSKRRRRILAISGGIMAAAAFITVVCIMFNVAINYMKATSNQNAVTEKETAKDDNGKNDETLATTRPVSVVESGNINGNLVDVSEIVEASMPCVVSITSTTSVEGYSVFGQHYQQEVPTGGTGFIVGQNDKELLLATNNHVVENATAIQVTFNDESTAEAVVKGTDAQADLAVIAVSLEDVDDDTLEAIKVAILGDSNDIKVGQMAIAIGNAQGMGQSVTVGYISAKDRKLDMPDESNGGTKTMTFLQTDAAINGGNSGGPLLNAKGEVVGINSAKISDTQVEGMCFAIPISSAIPIINDLMNRETLTDEEKGYMGISLKDISSEAVELYGVPDGVYVASVSKNGPADKAGIKEGDIITAINETTVNSSSAAVDKVNSFRAGTEITVTLYRQSEQGNGYDKTDVKVKLVTAEEAGINKNNSQGSQNNNSDNGNYGDDYDDDSSDYDDFFNDMLPW